MISALGWKWKDFDELQANKEETSALKDILKQRSLNFKKGLDPFIQIGENLGIYNSKDVYKIIVLNQKFEKIEIPISLCWDKSCFPERRCS